MSPVNLKKLIKTRDVLKQRQIRFKDHLDAFLDSVEGVLIGQVDKANILELEMRLDTFQATLQEFEEVQVAIEDQTDNVEENYLERETFEKSYFSLIAKCKQTILDYYKAISPPLPDAVHGAKLAYSANDAYAPCAKYKIT